MTSTQGTTDAARNAIAQGLLASGISVDGVMASNNPAVAAEMFRKATTLDPGICDAWLARIVAGDDGVDVVAAAWNARESYGWEIHRLNLRGTTFRPDGLRRAFPASGDHLPRGAALRRYAVALIREGRFAQADRCSPRRLPQIRSTPTSTLTPMGCCTSEPTVARRAGGVLPLKGGGAHRSTVRPPRRWPLPRWRRWGCSRMRFAALSRPPTATWLPQAATIALYTQAMCLRHLDKDDDAKQLLRRVYSRDAKFAPARQALDDPTIRLVLTSPEAIESRTNPWDPDSAPSPEALRRPNTRRSRRAISPKETRS